MHKSNWIDKSVNMRYNKSEIYRICSGRGIISNIKKFTMKCVCGYEYKEVYFGGNDKNKRITKGDEPFIGKCFGVSPTFGGDPIRPDAYACPKCKTLRIP